MFSSKNSRTITVCCVAVVLLLAVVLVLLLLPAKEQDAAALADTSAETQSTAEATAEPTTPPNEKIPKGVTIAGVSVGKMTQAEAMEAVQSAISDSYQQESMTILLGEDTYTITPEASAAHLDIEAAVAAALTGEQKEITLSLSIDEDAVEQELRNFYNLLGGIYTPSGYWLEGEAPDMDTQEGDCQTLVLNAGCAGYVVDFKESLERVLEAYQQGVFEVELEPLGEEKEPAELDLEAVSAKISVAAVNPRVDADTLEVIPGKDGYGFDIEEAEALLSQAEAGESVRISMEFQAPEVSEEDAWFQDTLGYCKTEYSDNENRTENLRLACEKLNGIILQPGETLSYNETLGERTTEAGYLPAPAYSGTELVDEVGGGICQVSSTLYLSSLFAELTIVERKNHGYPASYIPLGLDATVNWGTTDLVIRNDYDLAVKILAEVSDGYVKVRIMGVERRDYYVKIEYRVDDHPSYAAAYMCKYDRETDEEISRELDHTSTYLEDVWCYPGYAENATDETEPSEDNSE